MPGASGSTPTGCAAVPIAAARSGVVFPATAARRGAPLRHHHAPRRAIEIADPSASWTRSPALAPRAKRALLNHFGSARGVKMAGLDDLEAAPGISHETARRGVCAFSSGRADGGVNRALAPEAVAYGEQFRPGSHRRPPPVIGPSLSLPPACHSEERLRRSNPPVAGDCFVTSAPRNDGWVGGSSRGNCSRRRKEQHSSCHGQRAGHDGWSCRWVNLFDTRYPHARPTLRRSADQRSRSPSEWIPGKASNASVGSRARTAPNPPRLPFRLPGTAGRRPPPPACRRPTAGCPSTAPGCW